MQVIEQGRREYSHKVIGYIKLLFPMSARLVGSVNIYRLYHVIQDSGRQLVQIEILPYLADKPVNVFCLFFQLYNFFISRPFL